jgi:hypothetical protein
MVKVYQKNRPLFLVLIRRQNSQLIHVLHDICLECMTEGSIEEHDAASENGREHNRDDAVGEQSAGSTIAFLVDEIFKP